MSQKRMEQLGAVIVMSRNRVDSRQVRRPDEWLLLSLHFSTAGLLIFSRRPKHCLPHPSPNLSLVQFPP